MIQGSGLTEEFPVPFCQHKEICAKRAQKVQLFHQPRILEVSSWHGGILTLGLMGVLGVEIVLEICGTIKWEFTKCFPPQTPGWRVSQFYRK